MRNAVMVSLFVLALVTPGCKKKNQTPEAPTVPSGPLGGLKDTVYNFSSAAIDPDGDSVSLRFYWGGEDTSDWSSFVPSGESITMNHSWSGSGTYSITAQAKDKKEDLSSWSGGHAMDIAPGIQWSKTFDGEDWDVGRSVQQTSDGGYVVVGFTSSYGAGSNDVWLIKTDANGSKVWDRTFGGTLGENGNSVQKTHDGGYIVGGSTRSYGAGDWDIWLIKTDANGNEVWNKTFGEAGSDGASSVLQTSDGGYAIAGSKEVAGRDHFWLIKTDGAGNREWDRTYGMTGLERNRLCSARQTSDGGYAAVGRFYVPDSGFGGIWLVKTDADGNRTWDRFFYGASQYNCWYSIQQTNDGGYIVAGTKYMGAGDYDVWLIKTDLNGDKVWDKTYGGNEWDEGFSVQQTADGGYIITGYTSSYGPGGGGVWVIKTDAVGNRMWDETLGGDNPDTGYSIQLTSDGGYIIAAGSESYGIKGSLWLIKLE